MNLAQCERVAEHGKPLSFKSAVEKKMQIPGCYYRKAGGKSLWNSLGAADCHGKGDESHGDRRVFAPICRVRRCTNKKVEPNEYKKVVEPKEYKKEVEPKEYNKVVELKKYKKVVEPNKYTKVLEPKKYKKVVEPKKYKKVVEPKTYKKVVEPKKHKKVEEPKKYKKVAGTSIKKTNLRRYIFGHNGGGTYSWVPAPAEGTHA